MLEAAFTALPLVKEQVTQLPSRGTPVTLVYISVVGLFF